MFVKAVLVGIFCALYVTLPAVNAAEPCRLVKGAPVVGTELKYVMCEDRCENNTQGVLVCSPQICTKYMTLNTPMGVPVYSIGFCNGSTDFDCREHLVSARLEFVSFFCVVSSSLIQKNYTL